MTIFLTDQSHYDGTITTTWAKRAMAEGIVAFTHKLGEGTSGEDNTARAAFNAYRAAGAEIMGPYWVVRSGAVGPQVDAYMRYLNKDVPWWQDEPYFFHQVDLELWTYDKVPASTGVAFANELQSRVPTAVALYASHGQYGNKLTGWKGLLWNANYGTTGNGPSRPFKSMYPGDDYSGWAAYSGQQPDLLQYTSNALIAGLTTCDASAYRGTVDELKSLVGGNVALTNADVKLIWDTPIVTLPPEYQNAGTDIAASGSLSSLMRYVLDTFQNTAAIMATLADPAFAKKIADAVVAELPPGQGGSAPVSDADILKIATATVELLRTHPLAPTA